MINKIFKMILIFSLCFSFIFQTNAAVSVSDGSAFLTKAELQSDLNNISNRMALLEDSLDAKIDSLVSSYLTRNGIWNGVAVDIDTSETHLTNSGFIAGWKSNETKTLDIWKKNANVEKTGMCVAVVHMEGVKKGDGLYRCYLRYGGGNWTGYEDDVKVVLWMSEIVNNLPIIKNSLVVSQSQQRVTIWPSSQGQCVVQLPLNNDFFLLSFVTKGNVIELGLTQYVWDYSTGDTSLLTEYGFVTDSYLNIYVSSCDIY